MRLRVGIVGAAGYGGGELLRLLLAHPHVEVVQATSRSHAGKALHQVHPNLRGLSALRFTAGDALDPVDVRFLALPHGAAARDLDRLAAGATKIVDLSADFRLADPAAYERWYGAPHACPQQLERFAYGLPEVARARLVEADRASGVGCNATAVILALLPFARAGLIERAVVEVKVGSSEAGSAATESSHHPERSGAVRAFAPVGHRHQGEVEQALFPFGGFELHLSITAIEMVRGVAATAHVFPRAAAQELDEKQLWKLYRETYGEEPFVRIVHERHGLYRHPEPKILAGTNLCDVGFEKDPASRRVVAFAALDNLGKGAAGSAVQAMNLMCGLDEAAGLAFRGLHPV